MASDDKLMHVAGAPDGERCLRAILEVEMEEPSRPMLDHLNQRDGQPFFSRSVAPTPTGVPWTMMMGGLMGLDGIAASPDSSRVAAMTVPPASATIRTANLIPKGQR